MRIADYENLGLSDEALEVLRYERGGLGGILDKIRKGAGGIYERVMQGLGRRPTPQSPFFHAPETAVAHADNNVAAAEEAGQMLQAQQQAQLNQHVLDYLHRQMSTRPGGTLAQGRSYPMRQGGRHSPEVNAQLHGECSDAGRRLNECKGDGREGTHSGRGARL